MPSSFRDLYGVPRSHVSQQASSRCVVPKLRSWIHWTVANAIEDQEKLHRPFHCKRFVIGFELLAPGCVCVEVSPAILLRALIVRLFTRFIPLYLSRLPGMRVLRISPFFWPCELHGEAPQTIRALNFTLYFWPHLFYISLQKRHTQDHRCLVCKNEPLEALQEHADNHITEKTETITPSPTLISCSAPGLLYNVRLPFLCFLEFLKEIAIIPDTGSSSLRPSFQEA